MTNATRAGAAVPELDREQLRAKLARGETFKLVMAASDFGFRAKHIPGSIHVNTHDARGATPASLDKNDDVVVYCSNADCNASLAVIAKLLERGYRNVSHYRGGLIDWEGAGLPLEGDWAGAASNPA